MTHPEGQTAKDFPGIADHLNKTIATMRKGIPDTMAGFSAMAKAATADGVLSPKVKELIAIGIAVAIRCDGCVAFHVKAARKHGMTREELLESLGLAIYMGGGPSMVTAAEVLEAFDQFEARDAAKAGA